MNHTTRVAGFFAIFWLLGGFVSAAENPLDVHNPGSPRDQDQTFALVEELSIGGGEEEHQYFHRARDLAVDAKGRIYVLDGGFCRIDVFEPDGTYLRSIGRRGEGPGEMKPATGLALDGANQRIWVLDPLNKRLTAWTLEGLFLTSLPFHKPLSEQLLGTPEGALLVNYLYYREDLPYLLLASYNSEGDRRDLIDLPRYGKSTVRQEPGSPMRVTPFHPRHYFAVDRQGRLLHGFSGDYVLNVLDGEGQVLRRIRREAPRLEVSHEDREAFWARLRQRAARRGSSVDLSQYKVPQWRQSFRGIWVDGQDRIWVRVLGLQEQLHFDVFDNQGVYRHRVKLPLTIGGVRTATIFDRPVFAGPYLYSVVRTQDGEILVKRYRLQTTRVTL